MNVTGTPTDGSRASWWKIAKLAAFWLFGCSAIGFVVASISGEFGSIVFLIMGVLVGLSGAICHSVVALRPPFARQSAAARFTILWVGAMFIPMAWTILGALNSNVPVGDRYVVFFCGNIAAMALVASICITLYEGRRSV
jgi:uncharacterized membrane protein